MKIGILTLSASDNCGSLLQCYALQRLLEIKGNEVEIINLVTKASKSVYKSLHFKYIKHPKRFVGQFCHYKDIQRQRSDYQSFRNQYLNLTQKVYSGTDDLAELDRCYDLIVCGSDQVWNVYMRDFDPAFLLPWCEKTRHIAYAVSLGDQKHGKLQDLVDVGLKLNQFAGVSVRENTAKLKFLQELGEKVDVCLDPTMCIPMSEWMKMTSSGQYPKEPYIFYYSYSYWNDKKNQIVREFAKLTGLAVYVINPSRWVDGKEKKYGFKIFAQSGPIAFLNLMKGCRFALVESLHGTVFSFLFQKQFFFLEDKEELDDRVNDLLDLLGMKNRVLRNKNVTDVYKEKILYSELKNQLEWYYHQSIDFLNYYCC